MTWMAMMLVALFCDYIYLWCVIDIVVGRFECLLMDIFITSSVLKV